MGFCTKHRITMDGDRVELSVDPFEMLILLTADAILLQFREPWLLTEEDVLGN